MSDGQVALPLTWMTILQTKKEDFPSALKFAVRTAELDPLCSATLFRLSSCHTSEKQYVSAHIYYERAVALLPVPEKAPHVARLARLQEQADDEKDKVFRGDIMSIFPLEVIINIFQNGLLTDPLFVLRQSWVSRGWRNCLNNSCPELWKSWTISHAELKGKAWKSRRAVWNKRSGQNISTITFKDFTIEAVAKIQQTLRNDGKVISKLEIQIRNPLVLHRLKMWCFSQIHDSRIEHLQVNGGRLTHSSSRYDVAGPQTLTCGIPVKIENLHTVDLNLVNFCDNSASWWTFHNRRRSPTRVAEPVILQYPSLKRLCVLDCEFDHVYAVSTAESTETHEVPYQADKLHNMLRGSPALQYLEVTTDWLFSMPEQTRYDVPITILTLKTAVLPPPSLWRIDIRAPNLESIAFRLPPWYNIERHEQMLSEEWLPMIPAIDDTPIFEESISMLKTAEFACCAQDDSLRLESWLPRLQSIERFGIRNASKSPYPSPAMTYKELDDRVSYQVLGILNDHPEWLPAMEEIRLEGCLVCGKAMVEYVRQRKRVAGCAEIRRLVLKKCNTLSEKAFRTLEQEVADFSVIEEKRAAKYIMKRYIDDDFKASEPMEEE